MKLYYHKTDGGAEYLMDTYIDTGMDIKTGKILHREGVVTDKTKFVVRIDGDITKDAELSIRGDEQVRSGYCSKCGEFNNGLNHTCKPEKYPTGDPAGHFSGCPALDGKPVCTCGSGRCA
jgi:hypothetical protein